MSDQQLSKTRIALVSLISLLFITASPSSVGRSSGPRPPRTLAEQWLSWSSGERANYVAGFLGGFVEGKRAGCYYYEDKITPYLPDEAVPVEKLPRLACLNALPDFVKPTELYVDAITDYYTKYPSDRQAGQARLLLELATPPGLDIDQIHRKLNQPPPK